MKIKVWTVATTIPAPGEPPCIPSVFGTAEEAEAYADEMLRADWEHFADWNETGVPYPGDWREANKELAAIYHGNFGSYRLDSHEITAQIAGAPAAPQPGKDSALIAGIRAEIAKEEEAWALR